MYLVDPIGWSTAYRELPGQTTGNAVGIQTINPPGIRRIWKRSFSSSFKVFGRGIVTMTGEAGLWIRGGPLRRFSGAFGESSITKNCFPLAVAVWHSEPDSKTHCKNHREEAEG
jgi:hypothetical protein